VAPDPVEISYDTLEKLSNFFWKNRNIVVLSGAGCRLIFFFIMQNLKKIIFW
jgi:hypothetical protein